MPADNRFGIDISDQMYVWFLDVKVPLIRTNYGEDTDLACIILKQGHGLSWDDPAEKILAAVELGLISGEESDKFTGPEGLLMNVVGKIRFYLRTGRNSVEALTRPDLVEPGDFPFEGAGEYRGYEGGVSGGRQESDWRWFCEIVDRYIELRVAAAKPAIEACKARRPGWKYLPNENPNDHTPSDPEVAAEG